MSSRPMPGRQGVAVGADPETDEQRREREEREAREQGERAQEEPGQPSEDDQGAGQGSAGGAV
jgi:hypothetical protein